MKIFRRTERGSAVISIDRLTYSLYGVHTTNEGRSVHLLLDRYRYGVLDQKTMEIQVGRGYDDLELRKLRNGTPLIVDFDARTFRLIGWSVPTM